MNNDHYIPQFYLRYFLDDRPAPVGHVGPWTPCLWVHNLSTRSWKARAPKKVAYKRGFNTAIAPDGSEFADVESMLSVIEGYIAALYCRFSEARDPSRQSFSEAFPPLS